MILIVLAIMSINMKNIQQFSISKYFNTAAFGIHNEFTKKTVNAAMYCMDIIGAGSNVWIEFLNHGWDSSKFSTLEFAQKSKDYLQYWEGFDGLRKRLSESLSSSTENVILGSTSTSVMRMLIPAVLEGKKGKETENL